MTSPYDALLIVSFGGPEKPDDVIPFLENVVRGRPIPRERLLEVAEHYYHFGGVSPINQHVRELIAALRIELDAHGIALPIYWGNRNWHPLLPDTLGEMAQQGIRRALAFVTSAYSSYSGCRQYRENLEEARRQVGPSAPSIDKLRVFFNHPEFIAANLDRLRAAWEQLPPGRQATAHLAFTAHSIPRSMADTCRYVEQLTETCRLLAEQIPHLGNRWQLVYQSRSGRPQDPWLEPDIGDHLRRLHSLGVADAVVAPIGFLSDHIEVLYDLDDEAQRIAREIGLNMVRAGTVGSHPRFVAMIRELIEERLAGAEQRCLGKFGPSHDVCPVDCCPAPMRPSR
ncbi:MAG: ferrochelatase [Planctomycetaceae bacterium]